MSNEAYFSLVCQRRLLTTSFIYRAEPQTALQLGHNTNRAIAAGHNKNIAGSRRGRAGQTARKRCGTVAGGTDAVGGTGVTPARVRMEWSWASPVARGTCWSDTWEARAERSTWGFQFVSGRRTMDRQRACSGRKGRERVWSEQLISRPPTQVSFSIELHSALTSCTLCTLL